MNEVRDPSGPDPAGSVLFVAHSKVMSDEAHTNTENRRKAGRGACPICKMWYDHEFSIACDCVGEEK